MKKFPVCAGCNEETYGIREEEGRMLCKMCRQRVGWEETEYYCPYCGHHGVQEEEGEGDFYVGSDHRCKNCRVTFHLC